MAKTTEHTISKTAWTIGAVLSVTVIGCGVYLWRNAQLSQNSAAVEQILVDDTASDFEDTVTALETSPVTPTETAELFVLPAPELDLVRVDPEGSTLVAGRGVAGSEVAVLLDGDEVARQQIAAGGEFVIFVTLEVSQAPQVLSLLAYMDGQTVASDASFILAPVDATPEAVSTAQQPIVADDPQEAPDIKTAEAELPNLVVSEPQTPAASEIDVTVDAVEDGSALKQTATEIFEQVATASKQAKDVSDTLVQVVKDVSAPKVDAAVTIVKNIQAYQGGNATEDTAEINTQSTPAPNIVPDVIALSAPAQGNEAEASVTQSDELTADIARVDGQSSTLIETQEIAGPVETQTAPKPNAQDAVATDLGRDTAVTKDEPSVSASADETVVSTKSVQAQNVTQLKDKEPVPAVEATPAPNPASSIAVLRADNSGVSLIQPATPVAPDLAGKIALDTISYSTSGDVLLAGRARPAALVRVYLDNAVVADFQVAQDGRWNGSLTSVAPGIYTLRVDEIDPVEGKVLSRLETPFKREAPEVLAPITTADNGVAAPKVQAVTVQQGDTLWAISNARYGSGFLFVRVFEANKSTIKDPDLIYPGQIFNLPE